jgi:hypothetical protein
VQRNTSRGYKTAMTPRCGVKKITSSYSINNKGREKGYISNQQAYLKTTPS